MSILKVLQVNTLFCRELKYFTLFACLDIGQIDSQISGMHPQVNGTHPDLTVPFLISHFCICQQVEGGFMENLNSYEFKSTSTDKYILVRGRSKDQVALNMFTYQILYLSEVSQKL